MESTKPEELPTLAEEPLIIKDFSLINPWEHLISELEEIIKKMQKMESQHKENGLIILKDEFCYSTFYERFTNKNRT